MNNADNKLDNYNWRAVIDAHSLESNDPKDWLHYGMALLQTIKPGPDVGKQLQQAALAFLQAQKEGATAEQVAEAQRQSITQPPSGYGNSRNTQHF